MKLYGVLVLVALVGCEKDATKAPPPSEVKLSADETAMLATLPAGNVALFGGNYLRFQKYLSDSPLSRLMGALTQSTGNGMAEWMNCFVAENVRALGAVNLEGAQVHMRSVMSGIQLTQLEACAKRAGFPTTMDADQKFLGIEFPNPQGPMKNGYLVVAGGLLYNRVSMQFPVTSAMTIDRAALEADIASIATKGSAANDKTLVSQIGTVDRAKAIWIVASAAGTPVADKFGTARATFDIANGIAMDATVQVRDKSLADQIANSVTSAKQEARSVGGALQGVLEKLQFKRAGDQLRLQVMIDNAQMNALVDQLASMMPAAL
jgi:hypothetical protein